MVAVSGMACSEFKQRLIKSLSELRLGSSARYHELAPNIAFVSCGTRSALCFEGEACENLAMLEGLERWGRKITLEHLNGSGIVVITGLEQHTPPVMCADTGLSFAQMVIALKGARWHGVRPPAEFLS